MKVTVLPAFVIGVAIESVFTSATVDLSVQDETPEASEIPQAPYVFVELVLVAVKVGVDPATGLSKASLRVMVTAEVATPLATIFDVPLMVE
jgi:hypothetical protein